MRAFRFAKWWFWFTIKAFFQDGSGQQAAAISYYVLFSIFPLLIFSVGIVGLFLDSTSLQQDLVDAVMDNLPLDDQQGRNNVEEAVRGIATGSGALSAVGIVVMAWSASSMFGSVRRALNTAFRVEKDRPLVQQKLVDLSMVFLFAPFFILSIALTTALSVARRASQDIPVVEDLHDALGLGWTAAQVLLPVSTSVIAFAALYWVVPARRTHLLQVLPGALIAALLFEAAKLGFGFYLANFSNYDVIFGSLGAVVAFLFWIFVSANLLLFGAEAVCALPAATEASRRSPQMRLVRASRRPLRQRIGSFLRGLVVRPRTG